MLRFKTLFRNPFQFTLSRPEFHLLPLCSLPLPFTPSLPIHKSLTQSLHHINPAFFSYRSSSPDKATPASLPTFNSYELSTTMLSALEKINVFAPTPIQDMVFKEWMKTNRHIVFASQTGTGKTLAYVIPLLEALKAKELKSKTILTVPKRPRAVIFVPNKELVIQTQSVIKGLCHQMKLKTLGLCGVLDYIKERDTLAEGVDIVIATFDRFEKHHGKQNVFLSQAEFFIVDEVDTFLDAAYMDQINHYINVAIKLPTNPRMVFLSSTFTEKMKQLFTQKFGKEQNTFTVLLDKNTHYNLSNLEHEFLHLPTLDKQQPLIELLKQYKKYIDTTKGATIIFCNSIPSCQSLEYFLKEAGHDCVLLHGDVPKKLRLQNLDRFKRREVNILICTDLGSRGLDFPWVNHIINFDFPKSASDYLHRAGRAGRAGRKGYVSSLYQNKDYKLIEELQASNNEDRPIEIKGSAYETRPKKHERAAQQQQENSLEKWSANPDVNKFLPQEYIQFKKEYEITQEKNPRAKRERVRGYKIQKDFEREKVRELKNKIKMPKSLRTTNMKYIKGVQSRLKRVHRKIQRRRDKEHGEPVKSAKGRRRRN